MSFPSIIEILGTVAFTISGAFSAMQKKLDWFGVLSIGFVTAIGGGTLRDVLIGNTPVPWMRGMTMPLTILVAGLLSIFFDRYIKNLKVTLFLFDTLDFLLMYGFDLHPPCLRPSAKTISYLDT